MNRDTLENIIKSIEHISKRICYGEEKDRKIEILKLDLALKGLKSSYLDMRINGLRDLSSIIKQTKNMNGIFAQFKKFKVKDIVVWIKENNVFEELMESKKTHQ